MLKLRALNEPESSSESEDEDNPRLSKEAQESNAVALYNSALRLQQNNETQEAVEVFHRILELPYLNEIENKSLSPLQTQTRLGCLKCLSTLYSSGPSKNLSLALDIFELLTELEPSNVNNWYRYGKVALELQDFSLAFDAFEGAYSCSSGHWGCIEKLVTLSYVLHDMPSCLKYCAIGLQKDPAFVKGLVFRDYVFEMNPWINKDDQSKKPGLESLLVGDTRMLDSKEKDQYLDEARDMLTSYRKRNTLLRKQEEAKQSAVVPCPYHLKTADFRELFRIIMGFQEYLKTEGFLLSTVDLSGILSEVSQSIEFQPDNVIENGEDLSESVGLRRSRSSSDEKDQEISCCDPGKGVIENDEKSTEDDSQTTERLAGEGAEDEGSQKKKAKKDVKWWQLEGKRRSQRVRGNLLPSSTHKPKSESSFAELLKNIIPPLLLVEDSNSRDKDSSKSSRRKSVTDTSKSIYFGTPLEAEDVKRFIDECGQTNISTIISKLVRLLCRKFKGNWPSGLDTSYLDLFTIYRATTINLQDTTVDCDTTLTDLVGDHVHDICKDDAFIMLTAVELLMDSMKPNDVINPLIYQFEQLYCNTLTGDSEFILRKMWMQIKHYLKLCKTQVLEYSDVQRLLRNMLELLNKQPGPYICYVPTQTDFKISSETLQDKISFAEKMENLNKINELYLEKNYPALVDILQFSLTSGDGDLKNRYYLAESYYNLGQIQCVEQCAKVCEAAIRLQSDDLLLQCLNLLKNIWNDMKEASDMEEYKIITSMLLQLLNYYDKRTPDQEVFNADVWCLLHSVLIYLEEKETAFYIEEDSVPNSVLLLQLGHDVLSGIGKCCAEDGKFLIYTMEVLLKLQGKEDYWGHEETKTCLDQAILCLFSHPNKKYKLKNVKDHGATGISLTWRVCCQLYQYYKLEELPEFDSYGSISVEVENLFQRIIQEMPEDISPKVYFKQMMDYVERKSDSKPEIPYHIPSDVSDMYYLIADFHLKNKEFQKAVEYYVWDLSIRPHRFDSWAAIALSKAEEIYSKLNSCDRFCIENLTPMAEAVVRCFQTALDLDEANSKLRIEFGSFLYCLHSIFSRELKFHTHQLSLDLFETIELKKNEYLLAAEKWFEPHSKANEAKKEEEDGETEEVWINHYMLGKVNEKLQPNRPEIFLKQYELAGKLLHLQGAPYPAKINYYNAAEFALEALEIHYRTHASILSYVERTEYSAITEELLMTFVQRAEVSPFVKSKQGRGENSESKKKKGGDETASKKEMAEINDLLTTLVGKVEELVTKNDSESSNDSGDSVLVSSEDDSSGDQTVKCSPAMSSFSLSAFKDKMREKELRQVKLAEEKSKAVKSDETAKPGPENKAEEYDGLLDNPFYADFASVKYGKIVSCCLKAMKECITRYPQSFKAYYRIAYCYKVLKKDLRKAREYMLGNNGTGANKIGGLYGERKQNNFFNGIWRNPSDDIDRPGSFPFHMAKSIQLLLTISQKLHDHPLLAEIGIQLSKTPDSHNTYLFTEDREQFSKEAIRSCLHIAKKSIPTDPGKLVDCGTRIYDTFTKFQKHSPRENGISPILLELYRRHVKNQFPYIDETSITLTDTQKFFQHLAWTSKTAAVSQKPLTTGVKVGENPKKQVDDKTAPTTSQADDSKKTRKCTTQRRISDKESATVSDQGKIASPATNPVPSLLPTMDLGNFGMNMKTNDISANFLAYRNQLKTYFANLPQIMDVQHHEPTQPKAIQTTKDIISKSQPGGFTNKQNPANQKHHTSQPPNNAANFPANQETSAGKINKIISTASRAIATSSTNLSHSTEERRLPAQYKEANMPSLEGELNLANQKTRVLPKSSTGLPISNQTNSRTQVENGQKKKAHQYDSWDQFQQVRPQNINSRPSHHTGTNLRKPQDVDPLAAPIVKSPVTFSKPQDVDPLADPVIKRPAATYSKTKVSDPLAFPIAERSLTYSKATYANPKIVDPLAFPIGKRQDTFFKPQRIPPIAFPIAKSPATFSKSSDVDPLDPTAKRPATYSKSQDDDPPVFNIVNYAKPKVVDPPAFPTAKRPATYTKSQDADPLSVPVVKRPATYSKPQVVDPLALPIVKRPIAYSKSLQRKNYSQDMSSRPLMSTSPFQSQTTAMNRPSLSGFASDLSTAEKLSRIPPAAHYQASFNSRPLSSGQNEPEVVDLTTKSPEKATTRSPEKYEVVGKLIDHPNPHACILEYKTKPVKRPISSVIPEPEKHYPLPPKKKHHVMPPSPVIMEPEIPDGDVEVITLD